MRVANGEVFEPAQLVEDVRRLAVSQVTEEPSVMYVPVCLNGTKTALDGRDVHLPVSGDSPLEVKVAYFPDTEREKRRYTYRLIGCIASYDLGLPPVYTSDDFLEDLEELNEAFETWTEYGGLVRAEIWLPNDHDEPKADLVVFDSPEEYREFVGSDLEKAFRASNTLGRGQRLRLVD